MAWSGDARKWDARLRALQAFLGKNGSLPSQYAAKKSTESSLFHWVHRQRQRLAGTALPALTEEQTARLHGCGCMAAAVRAAGEDRVALQRKKRRAASAAGEGGVAPQQKKRRAAPRHCLAVTPLPQARWSDDILFKVVRLMQARDPNCAAPP